MQIQIPIQKGQIAAHGHRIPQEISFPTQALPLRRGSQSFQGISAFPSGVHRGRDPKPGPSLTFPHDQTAIMREKRMEVQDPADARRRRRKDRQKFSHVEVDPILDLLTRTRNDTLHSPSNVIVFLLSR